jgi:D-alanyl-D-alanine carboxypeptidase/D-alanyl-D-alanine-endopeptidase (penicillin-binding protein 4)
VFAAPLTAHAQWAVDVRSVDSGERLYSLNAGKLMMPASNMKILTLAAAAATLGWHARFRTTLETSAEVHAGALEGDLFVRGGGDPTINTRDGRADAVFGEWAAALQASGITEIRGRLVGDDQAFDEVGLGEGWGWDDLQYGYAAPVGALQFNENAAALIVSPAAVPGDPAAVYLQPGSGLVPINRAVTGAPGSATTIRYERRLDAPVLEVSGSIAAGAATITRGVAVVNPTIFFVQSLKDGLAARGIRVHGAAVDLDDIAAEPAVMMQTERRILVASDSPCLHEIARVLMKVSQNLYAETLLKGMGVAHGGLGTSQAGRLAARAALAAWGIPEGSYIMADASGLSRYNYVTAAAIASLLERVHQDPVHRGPFVASLPVAGEDGTIRKRLRRTRAEGNAAAKTGSISNVRALSGYVHTRDGEVLAFAILANDFIVPAATVEWMIDLAVEILANFRRQAEG